MVKQSQSTPVQIHSRRRRSPEPVTESAVLLADLEARFGRFRAEHPRGTRVPSELRAAALAALGAGVAAGALDRACGISWSQLETWKAAQQRSVRTGSRTRRAARSDVRVFSVIDNNTEPAEQASARLTEQDLELRLGRWSLRVRLAEPWRGE